MEEQDKHLLYFALTKDGLPLLDVNFIADDMKFDSDLLVGFTTSVQNFLKEIIQSDSETFDQGAIKFVFEKGEQVRAVIIVDSPSTGLRDKTQKLLRDFETKYKEILQGNMDNTSYFEDFKKEITKAFAEETIKE